MNMFEAVRQVYRKTFTWAGRATRAEFWWFLLLSMIVYVASIALSIGLETAVPALVWALAFVAPSLAVAARRLHDTDRTAAWLLLGIVPYAGIVLLVFYCLPGTPGLNRYGRPDPVAAASAHRKLGLRYHKMGEYHVAAGHSALALVYAVQTEQDVEPDLAMLATQRDRLGDQGFLARLNEVVDDAGAIVKMLDERGHRTSGASGWS